MTEGLGVREGKVFSKLIAVMTMKSKQDKNGGLTVPAKCVSVEIATFISVKRCIKVIPGKNTSSLFEHILLSVKSMSIIEKWEVWNSRGFSVIPVYYLRMHLAVRTDYSITSSLNGIYCNKKFRDVLLIAQQCHLGPKLYVSLLSSKLLPPAYKMAAAAPDSPSMFQSRRKADGLMLTAVVPF